ncbi:MAG: hypothetical protein JXN59_00920 [Anaerolineae bacterium]|nr:hypothetical protein [Anaerolineae bacterium]
MKLTLPRRTIVMILVLLTALPLGATYAQEGDSELNALLDSALAALSAEVGQTVTEADLSGWNWREEFFADASLGCPQPDMAYAQQITRGFALLLDYNGTVYDYRLTPDAQVVILCASETSSAPTPAPAQPPAQEEPAATLPAPENTPEGAVDSERLLNITLSYLNNQLGTAITRLNVSRWTWEETTWGDTSLGCPQPDATYDDSTPVRGYSLTIEYVDQVYEVHMTPDGRTIMPCGDNPQLQPVIDGLTADGLAFTFEEPVPTALPADEQEAPAAPQLVYTGPDGNVFATTLSDYPGEQVTDLSPDTLSTPTPLPRFDHIYGLYRWSPDGSQVAFVDSAPPASLYIANAENFGFMGLQTGGELATLYPPAWKPDGSEIAFIRPTQTFRGGAQVMEVYATLASGLSSQQPSLLASFEQRVGCGGGSSDPADTVYARETGFMGNALTFEWLADNTLLVSPACTGAGLLQIDLASGEATELDLAITRLSFNPERTQAAGLVIDAQQNAELVILDLASGARQPVNHQIDGTPDQVYWSPDGTALYVSTVDIMERIARSNSQDSIGIYNVRLWQVDLASGATTLRFEQQGRGIGSITSLSDGSLAFSFVEDARAWAAAADSGADAATQRAAAPAVWLLRMAPDGQLERIGAGGQPAAPPALPDAIG